MINNNKTKLLIYIKKLSKTKNIIFLVLILVLILLIGSVFRYIHIQNSRYQRLSEESTIEQRAEKAVEEEKLIEKELPEREAQTGTVERDFRDNTTIMIF